MRRMDGGTETQTEIIGADGSKNHPPTTATVAPSYPDEILEFARTESDPEVIKKKLFGITGKQATLQDVAQIKALVASQQREVSLASFSGDISDYHKRAIVEQHEICSYLRGRVLAGDDEALKFLDKNMGVLERMVNQKAETQNNTQVNIDVGAIMEKING